VLTEILQSSSAKGGRENVWFVDYFWSIMVILQLLSSKPAHLVSYYSTIRLYQQVKLSNETTINCMFWLFGL
jgi:hypothetical protein